MVYEEIKINLFKTLKPCECFIEIALIQSYKVSTHVHEMEQVSSSLTKVLCSNPALGMQQR